MYENEDECKDNDDRNSDSGIPDDFKTINNLKLFKRRTKDYYEDNKKKPGIFSVSSSKLNNQNYRD